MTTPDQGPQALPLDVPANVTLDGSGNGVASVGPGFPREHWYPDSCAVLVATNTNEAACSLYIGPAVSPQWFMGQTSKGSSGATASLGETDVYTGYRIWCVWTGGDPGAQATMRVKGTRSIGALTP